MKYLSALLLLIILTSLNAKAQEQHASEWNYETYPEMPYDLEHLELNLTLTPSAGQIKGIAVYHIRSQREELIQVILNTADLEIQSITFEENGLDFQVNGDSLIIQLQDTLFFGQQTQFQLTWQSESQYGIQTDYMNHMWTSLNPKMVHHWLPVLDHPEVTTTFEADIIAPANMEVIFNGRAGQDEILSTEMRKTKWSSKIPVPVTQLTLSVGEFEKREAISGIKEISIFANENLMSEVRDDLLQIAVNSLKQIERSISFEYPYESLNIVVLPDNYWNEIQYGAGVIYLYQNLGSLSTQLRRGIAAQWLGSYQAYLDEIEHADKYELLRFSILQPMDVKELVNPDSLQTISNWNKLVMNYNNPGHAFFVRTIEESLPELIRSKNGVIKWDYYASHWYDETGYYWENPSFAEAEPEKDSSFSYDVRYIFDEQNALLVLEFEARNGRGISYLSDVMVTEYGFSDTTTSIISFTGLEDRAEVEVSSAAEYVTLQPDSELDITFIEYKPFLFLINQLRSEDAEDRRKAAEGLIHYKENPDLQLALQDVYNREENAEVKAALLTTLAEVLNGAVGTEQTFIDELNAGDTLIQKAAIQALSHYPEDEAAIYALQNILLRTKSDSLFAQALASYKSAAGNFELLQLSERFLRSDTSGRKTLEALKTAMPDDTSGQSFEIADRLLDGRYAYAIRSQVVRLLQQYQQDAEFWTERLPALLNNRDPRIRFIALKSLQHLDEEIRNEFLRSRKEEEFDIRILQRIEELQSK